MRNMGYAAGHDLAGAAVALDRLGTDRSIFIRDGLLLQAIPAADFAMLDPGGGAAL